MAFVCAFPVMVLQSNTDAEFRAWGSTISTHLALMGLVQTADTGQVNWATVAKPSLGDQFLAYEIWQFADALQAVAPIFFKIEYGSAGGGSRPTIRLRVGSASNGAGTLTGVVSPLMYTTLNSQWAYATYGLLVGNVNRCAFVANAVPVAGNTVPNAESWMFSIERTHDEFGEGTAEGVIVLCTESQGLTTCCLLLWAKAAPPESQSWYVPGFTEGPQLSQSGPTAVLGTIMMFDSDGLMHWPPENVITVPAGTLVRRNAARLPHYGKLHQWFVIDGWYRGAWNTFTPWNLHVLVRISPD